MSSESINSFKKIFVTTLRDACKEKLTLQRISPEARKIVPFITQAMKHGRQIPLFTETEPGFDQTRAYEVSAALCHRVGHNGLQPVGRKIGFTNTSIWPQYNVSEPNWGYLYNGTTYKEVWRINLPPTVASLEPKIEPEIIFGLRSPPKSSMSEAEALGCVAWMAHGYEIVRSPFKDWKFTLADTTAVNALHSRLFIGRRRFIHNESIDAILSELENFQVVMKERKGVRTTGSGSNVLGSPIKALLHLCRTLESQSLHPGLCSGEIISTGTLTNAMPVIDGDVWTTELTGIDLPGLEMQVTQVERLPVEEWEKLHQGRHGFNRVKVESTAQTTAETQENSLTESHIQTGKDGMVAKDQGRQKRLQAWQERQGSQNRRGMQEQQGVKD